MITRKQKSWMLENLHRYNVFCEKFGDTLGGLLASLAEWRDRFLWRRRKSAKIEKIIERVTGWEKADYPETKE
jgi:hypothetical protein